MKLTQVLAATSVTIAALFSSSTHASDALCYGLFHSRPPGATDGVLEAKIADLEVQVRNQRVNAEARIALLDPHAGAWRGLPSEFVRSVYFTVRNLRNQNANPRASKSQREKNTHSAIQRIDGKLKDFFHFEVDGERSALNRKERRLLAVKILTKSDISSENGLRSPKHMLYQAMYDHRLRKEDMLRDTIKVLEAISFNIHTIEERRIPKLKKLIAAKRASSVADLRQRRENLVSEIKAIIAKTPPVPTEITAAITQLAVLYGNARKQNRPTDQIEAQWLALTENEFFKSLNDGDLEAIGDTWKSATTPEAVIKIFVTHTTAGGPALPLRMRDLDEVETALKYLP